MTYKVYENGVERQATTDEITEIESRQNLSIPSAQNEAARQAVLDKLGLTADEAAALLG